MQPAFMVLVSALLACIVDGVGSVPYTHRLAMATSDVATDSADHAWGGGSAYLLWACNATVRATTLDAMKAADMKVLRIFLTQSWKEASWAQPPPPGCDMVRDLEYPLPGAWNATNFNNDILERVDALASDAHARGIKLTVALHDRAVLLGTSTMGITDAYVKGYNVSAAAYGRNQDCGNFYANPDAQAAFAVRLQHALDHVHPAFNRSWAQLPELFFSFEAENEEQLRCTIGKVNKDWLCSASQVIHKAISGSGVVVTSGGGGCGVECVADPNRYAQCENIDVLAMHDYTDPALLRTRIVEWNAVTGVHGKRFFVQEFGCKDANATARVDVCNSWIAAANSLATPWMLWSVEPHNTSSGYDGLSVFPGDAAWSGAVVPHAKASASAKSRHKWPEVWGNGDAEIV